jgi:hypothetical protein
LKLEDIEVMWDKDSHVDMANLGAEAARNPQLHSKYLRLLNQAKLSLRKAEGDYLRLRGDKYRYFKGEMTKEELAEHDWVQYQGRVPLKSEMDEYLKTDRDMIRLTDKAEYYETMKTMLESILKAIASRGFELKSAIEWVKIQNGLM